MTDYDAEFYDYIDMGAFVSANEVLPKLWSEIGFKPKSMIDVGCGTGAWLKVAQALGINDVVGVDGDYNHHAPVTLGSSFQEFDLAKPFESSRKFSKTIVQALFSPHHFYIFRIYLPKLAHLPIQFGKKGSNLH